MTRIWEIFKSFKNFCSNRGWKISENEDWVKVNHIYHNFLWARNVHPASFKSILTNRKCVVQEGLSYHVVEASYIAWLFSETPSETLVREFRENPDLQHSVALYDLSAIIEGKNVCMKLNDTDSVVFQEFENFLKTKLKVKLKTLSSVEPKGKNFTVLEAKISKS